MKFLSLSILALFIALPISPVYGESDVIPQKLKDLVKKKGEIRKEIGGLLSDIDKAEESGASQREIMALKRKLMPVSGELFRVNDTIRGEIENSPELRKAVITKYEHALTPEVFWRSFRDLVNELQLGEIEQDIIFAEIDRRLSSSFLLSRLRAENRRIVEATLKFVCGKDPNCSGRIEESLSDLRREIHSIGK